MTRESNDVWLLEGAAVGPKGKVRYKGRLSRVDINTLKKEVLFFVIGDEDQGTRTNIWKHKR